jgi:hypothetical protein
MFQKKILIISTSIAVALTVASQASADVNIIHNADGGTDVQAGNVKVSVGGYGGDQVETGGTRLSTTDAFLVSRRSRRRYGKPIVIPSVKTPNIRIPSVPVVRTPNSKIPSIPIVRVPTVIQRTETYGNGSVYSTRTSTRSSNGSSSNSQSTVIRGDGHSNTNSNHDSDD